MTFCCYAHGIRQGSSFTAKELLAVVGAELRAARRQAESDHRVRGVMFAGAVEQAAGISDSGTAPAADWEDIRASMDGDGDAFARLVRRYEDAIAAYMWRFTRERTVWEELVQDVFVEAYLSLHTYRGRSPLLHWIKRIATRVGYKFWRKKQRAQNAVSLEAVMPDLVVERSDPLSCVDAAELVHFLLGRLSPRDRLVLTLSYLERYSVDEIGELTGWSRSLVKVQLHRARIRLKKLCRDAGIEL